MKEFANKNYCILKQNLQSVNINVMFALSVLEGRAKGKVLVDNETTPSLFYIQNSCGMSLLYGNISNQDVCDDIQSYMLNLNHVRKNYEWLQVFPTSLSEKIDIVLGNNLIKKDPNEQYNSTCLLSEDKKVLEYKRINFKFNKDKFLESKRNLNNNYNIITTPEEEFQQMLGTVIPRFYWHTYHEFVNCGTGFTLLSEDNIPASTAFAAFVIDNKLEIGIETVKDYQGLGYAVQVCTTLISYCLDNGYEPVWSCNSANLGSRNLAIKLGFEEVKRISYYRLPN